MVMYCLFWNSLDWEVPCTSRKADNGLCSFVCTHSSHKDDLNFCTKNAWHLDSHVFECVHPKSSGRIDLVFCCDCTGSMGSYLDKSKTTIKKVISDVKATDV
jgi:hypothetical protein